MYTIIVRHRDDAPSSVQQVGSIKHCYFHCQIPDRSI